MPFRERKAGINSTFWKMENFSVFDTIDNKILDCMNITCKNGIDKWRIKTGKAYQYFIQKDIDGYLIRKQIQETPVKTLQFHSNVEATIFQLGYHYPNAKSRYGGEIKHQMWANIRCLWLNFVRLLKYIKQLFQKTLFIAKFALKSLLSVHYFALKSFLTAISPNYLSCSENIRFSEG